MDGFVPEAFSRMMAPISAKLLKLCIGDDDAIEALYSLEDLTVEEFRLPKNMANLKIYRNVLLDVFHCNDVLGDFDRMPLLTTLIIGQTR